MLLTHGQPVNLVSCTDLADHETSLGHMFNQHYLNPMFPPSKRQTVATKGKKNVKWKFEGKVAGHDADRIEDKPDEPFLDRVVTTDEKLAIKRDFTELAEINVMRRESGLEFGNGQVLKDCGDANDDGCLTFLRTASDRLVVEEARDKTVKELSRLWKYLEGKSPMDHDSNEAGYPNESPQENPENRDDYRDQPKANRKLGNGSVLEQQRSPISSTSHIRHSLTQVAPLTSISSM